MMMKCVLLLALLVSGALALPEFNRVPFADQYNLTFTLEGWALKRAQVSVSSDALLLSSLCSNWQEQPQASEIRYNHELIPYTCPANYNPNVDYYHPQMQCKGDLCARECQPTSITCYQSVNEEWKCFNDTLLPIEGMKMGNVYVVCEPYYSSDDPYILEGSCFVEYELIFSVSKFCYTSKLQNCATLKTCDGFSRWYVLGRPYDFECSYCKEASVHNERLRYKQSDLREWSMSELHRDNITTDR